MPQPLTEALAALRPLLVDPDSLVRAVGAGHRRGERPATTKVEIRPVDLKTGRCMQLVRTGSTGPATSNHAPGEELTRVVDGLLAEPYSTWYVETVDRVVQLRVTKRGEAQVHSAATSRRGVDVSEPERAHDRARSWLLDPADPVFSVLGGDADKRRQVDAFLRQLATAVQPLRQSRAPGDGPLRVVDLGCGNAYLTVAAHRWLSTTWPEPGVRTTGVDIRPELVARNRLVAERLGLTGLHFVSGSITASDPDDASTTGGGASAAGGGGEPVPAAREVPGGDSPLTSTPEVDVVLALHACDTATDDALARAVRWRAPVLLAAPCCHHDLQRQLAARSVPAPHPWEPVLRWGILRERFADVLTDTLRAQVLRLLGYRVDVVEFVDSRHTPRNVMLRARYTGAAPSAAVRSELVDLVEQWQIRPALAQLLAPELAGRGVVLPGSAR